jgi:acetolactate synthase-1/3 small subunit
MTIVVKGTDADIEQAGKQLYKLMEVLKVIDLTDQAVVAHEMAIVKVAAKAQQRQEVLLIAQMFNGRVLDASPNTIMIEATGTVEQIESLLGMLRSFGIRELARTGAIAMTKGSGIITSKGLAGTDQFAASTAAD